MYELPSCIIDVFIGREVITAALDLPKDTPVDKIVEEIQKVGAVNPNLRAIIDRHYKSALDNYTNDINRFVHQKF